MCHSTDGTVYVNAPIRGMTGVSDATTAGGGSLRTLDHTSLGLTSVAEEGAGRGPRNARTSSTGLDDTSLASPLANGNAAGGSGKRGSMGRSRSGSRAWCGCFGPGPDVTH